MPLRKALKPTIFEKKKYRKDKIEPLTLRITGLKQLACSWRQVPTYREMDTCRTCRGVTLLSLPKLRDSWECWRHYRTLKKQMSLETWLQIQIPSYYHSHMMRIKNHMCWNWIPRAMCEKFTPGVPCELYICQWKSIQLKGSCFPHIRSVLGSIIHCQF